MVQVFRNGMLVCESIPKEDENARFIGLLLFNCQAFEAAKVKHHEYNGHIESFIKTKKSECLDHLILTSEAQLRYLVKEFLEYYNHERPHSGLGGKMIIPRPQDDDGEVTEFSRLDGLLKSYRRVKKAA